MKMQAFLFGLTILLPKASFADSAMLAHCRGTRITVKVWAEEGGEILAKVTNLPAFSVSRSTNKKNISYDLEGKISFDLIGGGYSPVGRLGILTIEGREPQRIFCTGGIDVVNLPR